MSSEELDYRLEGLIQQRLDQIGENIGSRITEHHRQLNSNLSELETQILDKISRLDKRLLDAEQRVKKLEDTSAWNLLLEEAKKHGTTPEALLKALIAEHHKKQRKSG